ncbi:hypothetical protein Acr_09g0005950 [Actinidia rufa]|uniref:Uncharacterized protein n=1 Tax=Actinidia rufa TaxID=165716 RepID=A0A7J0F7E2_9ERIC|nr:hypothetical protein Acr_09g0005950 [Actinidia rufa]
MYPRFPRSFVPNLNLQNPTATTLCLHLPPPPPPYLPPAPSPSAAASFPTQTMSLPNHHPPQHSKSSTIHLQPIPRQFETLAQLSLSLLFQSPVSPGPFLENPFLAAKPIFAICKNLEGGEREGDGKEVLELEEVAADGRGAVNRKISPSSLWHRLAKTYISIAVAVQSPSRRWVTTSRSVSETQSH